MKCFAFLLEMYSSIKEIISVMGNQKALPMPPEIREFHTAVIKNDVQKVKQFVDAGIDVNFPWQSCFDPPSIKDGSTPLCEAVSLNHRSIVEALINSGAWVNKADKFGCTPLHKASYHGRAALAEILIKAGAELELCDLNMNTPLHICAQSAIVHSNVDTVRVLIQAGANVNASNCVGKIALHYAAVWGLGEITSLLIKAESRIDYMDHARKTPLFSCICSINGLHGKRTVFEKHLPSIKVLIMSGCDPLNLASWLYEHNILTDTYHIDEEFYSWYCASRPESLKHLCRQAIQRHFNNDSICNKLPLPCTLVEYTARLLL